MMKINQKAPNFTLPDQEGQIHKLSDYSGQYILLYFYPKDDTPGCTTEAKCVRDRMNEFKTHHIQVLGVSADSIVSHKKFAEKYHLNFPLLADTEKKVITAYDVLKQKSLFSKTFLGIERDSFLISPEGKILKRYTKVNPSKHIDEVLDDIVALKK